MRSLFLVLLLVPLAGCIVEAPPPPPGYTVWRPGHWRWNGYRYAWVPGHYVVRGA